MIREATLDDINGIYQCAIAFHSELLKQKGMPFNNSTAKKYISWMIEYPQSLFLVAKNHSVIGCIGGVLNPWLLDENVILMTEMIWYVLRKDRGSIGIRLIKAFEKKAQEMGATKIIMISLGETDDPISLFYKRKGYHHLEHHFIKDL